MSAAAVRASGTGPVTGLIAQVLLLAVLAATAGLDAAGWVVAVVYGVMVFVAGLPGAAVLVATWARAHA